MEHFHQRLPSRLRNLCKRRGRKILRPRSDGWFQKKTASSDTTRLNMWTHGSMHKTCKSSSKTKSQHWEGWSKHWLPTLFKIHSAIETTWQWENQFSQIGYINTLGQTTWVYLWTFCFSLICFYSFLGGVLLIFLLFILFFVSVFVSYFWILIYFCSSFLSFLLVFILKEGRKGW